MLQERLQELEQQNAALAARLSDLERAMQVKTQPPDTSATAVASAR